jgi:hypothetical protein
MAEKRGLVDETVYHIRVKGRPDETWVGRFKDFAAASRGNGETLLTGAAVDGVLGEIEELGLRLLLMVQTACPCSAKNCARRGQCRECAAHYSDNGRLPFCLRERTKWEKRCTALTEGR